DRDHHDLLGWRARACLDGEVVSLALEAGKELARRAEKREQRDHHAAEEPVGFPETRLHCGARSPLSSREKILRYGSRPGARKQLPLKQQTEAHCCSRT